MSFRHAAYAFLVGAIFTQLSLQAQNRAKALENTAFASSEISWNTEKFFPEDIKMKASSSLNAQRFFTELRHSFDLPEDLKFVPQNSFTDQQGNTHVRHKLQYKGLEISHAQYILHQNQGRVYHAHGKLIKKPDDDLQPSLSMQEAYSAACRHLGISENDAQKAGSFLTSLAMGNEAAKNEGRLMLSAGQQNKNDQDYRLVYVFDIATMDPMARYDVHVDAHSGKLVGTYATLHRENIQTKGLSLYNDTVDIVVSDSIIEGDWPDIPTYWQLDNWNSFQDSGLSWWLADTLFFLPGGYGDNWHQALTSDPVVLSTEQAVLSFFHRYALESPDGATEYNDAYDGWDGINVRISTDGAESWEVLSNPEPAYTSSSLWSFGNIHGEGPGIPGWAGKQEEWEKVTFDLANYQDDTIIIRFEFASDAGWSSLDDSTLFGWQIDNIQIGTGDEVLYSNTGEDTLISGSSRYNWVTYKKGKYRLRETTRGKGIATINARSMEGFRGYVDFVQDSLPLMNDSSSAGVGIHWAAAQSYDYFLETFMRNSFDDQGGAIISYADWMVGDARYDAFWAGTFMGFGAGDEVGANSLGTIDIIGHEFTHGVTQHSANLIYRGESGALNESFSDIFGTAIEFYVEGMDQGDWLSGEDLFTDGRAGRSLENPKRFLNPDTYLGTNWVDVTEPNDFGGVHTNSGVQNHWFYLLSEGGTGSNDDKQDYIVEGIGLDAASAIAYRNLTTYLMPDSKYKDAATYAIQSARDLYGEDSPQALATLNAWEAVGIYLGPRLTIDQSESRYSTRIGRPVSRGIELTNLGTESVTITDIMLSDTASFSISPAIDLPRELKPREVLETQIEFNPVLAGEFTDSLIIMSSDPGNPVIVHHMSGRVAGNSTDIVKENTAVSDMDIRIHPNPFTNQLIISFELPGPDDIQIEIRDMAGRLVYQSKERADKKGSHEIMWGSGQKGQLALTKGVYLLSLRTSDHFVVRKIIKQ